jgi:hypothetical protein
MRYEEKLAIANAYLDKKANIEWDELSDINSLHDCDSQEDIISACDARLLEDGFAIEDGSVGDIKNEDDDEHDYAFYDL